MHAIGNDKSSMTNHDWPPIGSSTEASSNVNLNLGRDGHGFRLEINFAISMHFKSFAVKRF